MDRLVFEQLISDWLDDRQEAGLRRKIDAACAADAECRRIFEQYERLDATISAASARMPAVNWDRFKAAVSAAVAQTEPEDADSPAVDAQLRQALGDIDDRVDWERYAQRVSRAVDESAGVGRRLRIRHWREIAAVAGLAAAAVILLWFATPIGHEPQPAAPGPAVAVTEPPRPSTPERITPLPELPRATPPVVAVAPKEPPIERPSEPVVAAAIRSGSAVVRVQVIEELPPPPPTGTFASRHGAQPRSEPEVFFMLEPPDRGLVASAAGFGSR